MTRRTALGLAAINLILIALVAWFSATVLLPPRGERFDFVPHWVGGRAIWAGQTPYTDAMTARIQVEMFGSTLPPEVDQQRMAYPAYVAWLIAPLLLISAPAAIALWTALQLVAMLWLPMIWVSLLQWRLPGLALVGLIFGLIFAFRYPINVYVLGQFTGTLAILLTIGIWCLLRGYDIAAGLLFVCASVPPTVSVPLALLILGRYALAGRWRGLATYVFGLALLVGATIVQIGWWIPDFVRTLIAYSGYSHPVWPPLVFGSPAIAIGVVAIVSGVGLWLGRRLWQPFDRSHQLRWAITVLLLCLLLIPQTGNYNQLLIVPPVLGCLALARTLPRRGRWLTWAACTLILASSWLYFIWGAQGYVGTHWETLLIPLPLFLVWGALNLSAAKALTPTPFPKARGFQPEGN